eukprot:5516794-Pyramimonas_sp.AAC.1
MRIRVAALLAQMDSPIEKVIDNRACLLKDADLSKLTAKSIYDDVQRAESMMEQARTMCDNYGLDKIKKLELTGQHDIRLALFLMKK